MRSGEATVPLPVRARDNPFRVERIHGLAYRFPPGDTMESLLARLAAHRFRGALVGGEGRGKSTLLGELARRLASRGFQVRRLDLGLGDRRIPPRERDGFLGGIGPATALLLDGAEQLSTPAWWAFRMRSRRAGALIVTSHRPGLLPTALRCETPPGILADLLDALAPGRPPDLLSPADLHHRHRGDIRQALFEAYDRWAEGPIQNIPTARTRQTTGTVQGARA